MSAPSGQIELLPRKAPKARQASLLLSELAGYEHATPSRELAEAIGQLGVLQPVVVAASAQSGYRIIEGRRRVKAIEQLSAAGRWPTPPRVQALIVGDLGECVRGGMTLALHAVRSPSPASELHAIEAILAAGAANGEESTIKQIAAQTGMPVQSVHRRLRLRALSPVLRAAFDRGALSVSVAEAAARLDSERQAVLERMLGDGERVTLAAVREISRRRTSQAVVELSGGLFADHERPWRATVRGHLQAALGTVPDSERTGALAQAIDAALALAGSPRDEESGAFGKEVAC